MDDRSQLEQNQGTQWSDQTQQGSPDAAAAAASLGPALESAGGIDGLMAKMRDAGLGDQVDSWVSSGPNQPVDPETIGQALGPDTVNKLSNHSGLNAGQLLPLLAMFLPQIINMLTPKGQVPPGGLDQQAAGSGGLGGLLGGLLGGALGGSTASGGAGSSELEDVLGGLGGVLGGNRQGS